MRLIVVSIAIAVALLLIDSTANSAEPTHAKLITQDEGSKTCVACHEKSAREFAESLHYQQQAEPQFLKNWEKGKTAGMLVSY